MAYDIRSQNTFNSIEERYTALLGTAAENCSIVLTGTKRDLVTDSNREVTFDEGVKMAKQLSERWNSKEHPSGKAPFFETSSLTGDNVQAIFEYIFETLTLTVDSKSGVVQDTVDLGRDTRRDKSNVSQAESKSKCAC